MKNLVFIVEWYGYFVPFLTCPNTLVKTSKLYYSTVKPVLSSHSKIDKTKILMTNGSLIKFESIAESSPLGVLCNTFDLH